MFKRILNFFKNNLIEKSLIKIKEKNNIMQEANTKKQFEIELYDEITDDNGDVKGFKKVVSEHPIIIEANNKADLDRQAQIFKLAGQKMKIVKVLNTNTNANVNTSINNDNSEKPLTNIVSDQSQIQQTNVQQIQPLQNQIHSQHLQSNKPKYYNVGGIEVKDDNGKIYQKQWVRLTENEAKNIRLVNETTNKIINTTGKSFEMKKWILVETKQEDDTLELENDEQI